MKKIIVKGKTICARCPSAGYSGLLDGVSDLLESARRASARAVNALMTATYWEVGRQHRRIRAGWRKTGRLWRSSYLKRLAADLTARSWAWLFALQPWTVPPVLPGSPSRPDSSDTVAQIFWQSNSSDTVAHISAIGPRPAPCRSGPCLPAALVALRPAHQPQPFARSLRLLPNRSPTRRLVGPPAPTPDG
jgi:hypothetical protein